MRKINVEIDEHGGTQVKIIPDEKTGKFLTKRDFDRSIRAIKLEYRRSIKEYRKQKILNEYLRKQKDGKETSKKDNTKTEQRTDPNEGNASSAPEVKPSSSDAKSALARAVAAKEKRRRGETAGVGSGTSEEATGSTSRGSKPEVNSSTGNKT